MIKILVVDDDAHKITALRALLHRNQHVSILEFAQNIHEAKRFIAHAHFDLVILDLNIPERAGDIPSPNSAIDFLKFVKSNVRVIKPSNIIGLSEFDELIKAHYSAFESDLWAIIQYSANSTDWSSSLDSKIEYLVQEQLGKRNHDASSFDYDLAIITALHSTEFEAVLNLQGNWKLQSPPNDTTHYYQGTFVTDSKIIRVTAAAAPQMGMVPSSVLSMKLIYNFRPKYLIMVGIAAGIRGSSDFGDILAADLSFDSGSGKIKTDGNGASKFIPDFRGINVDTDIRDRLYYYSINTDVLQRIKRNWPAAKPVSELKIHIGPFASGAGVVENSKIIEEISGHSRKLIGIDMEAYGVYYAAKNCNKPRPLGVLSIKSVCDFADKDKNDNFQNYAAYTSAQFLFHFVTEKLDL